MGWMKEFLRRGWMKEMKKDYLMGFLTDLKMGYQTDCRKDFQMVNLRVKMKETPKGLKTGW
jgi:hypothetical protein